MFLTLNIFYYMADHLVFLYLPLSHTESHTESNTQSQRLRERHTQRDTERERESWHTHTHTHSIHTFYYILYYIYIYIYIIYQGSRSLQNFAAAASLNTQAATCQLRCGPALLSGMHRKAGKKWRVESGWRWNKHIYIIIIVHGCTFFLLFWCDWLMVYYCFLIGRLVFSRWLFGGIVGLLAFGSVQETKMAKRQASANCSVGSAVRIFRTTNAKLVLLCVNRHKSLKVSATPVYTYNIHTHTYT